MLSYDTPDRFRPKMRKTYRTLPDEAFGHFISENQRFRLPTGLKYVTGLILVVGGQKEYKIVHQSIKMSPRPSLPHKLIWFTNPNGRRLLMNTIGTRPPRFCSTASCGPGLKDSIYQKN